MSVNIVSLSGRLTRDAELRQTAGGMAVATFCVAVNDRQKNAKTGEWEDYPNFINCVLFGKRAEGVAPYLTKGIRVSLSGKLRYSSWEKDGNKFNKIEVIANELDIHFDGKTETKPAQIDGDVPF